MNQHIQGLANLLAAPPSEADRRWEANKQLERTDPMLAKLFRAEAIADHRAENHVCEAAKLPMIRDLLREVIELRTGRAFKNVLFP